MPTAVKPLNKQSAQHSNSFELAYAHNNGARSESRPGRLEVVSGTEQGDLLTGRRFLNTNFFAIFFLTKNY